MRRTRRAAVALAAVVAVAAGGCAASGSSTEGSDPMASTSSTTTTAATAERSSTTSTTAATAGSGELATWDDVVDTASADHGTVVRHVNAVDGSGDPLLPDMGIELAFDADQQIVHATIDVPPTEGSPGGTIEYVYAPGRTLMAVESITGACPTKWVSIDDALSDFGAETGMDLPGVAQIPMPPYDLVLDHAPEAPASGDGVTTFPFEVPASLLVSAKIQAADPDHWADLEAMQVPAELRLHPDGTLELEASAPLEEVLPPAQLQTMPVRPEGFEMVGSWTLDPSEEPLGLVVPDDVVTMDDDCISGS